MRKYLVIITVSFIRYAAAAQQLPTSSLYDVQGVIQNPAMAGVRMKTSVGVSYRSQWAGFSNSPKTATVFGSFELPEQKIGLGAYIYNDKTGPTSRTGVQLAFAKHIPLNNGGKFSLGIEARGIQFAIDREKLSQSLGNDPVLGSADSKFKFDAGFGVAYKGKNLELGASVAQLIQSKLDFYTGNTQTAEEGRLYRHYLFHGAYKWNVDGVTSITPQFMMIYLPNAKEEIQVGARVEHNELFWWGLSHRFNQSFIFSAGVNLQKKFTLGYAFDIYNQPYNAFEKGSSSHEIVLRYGLK